MTEYLYKLVIGTLAAVLVIAVSVRIIYELLAPVVVPMSVMLAMGFVVLLVVSFLRRV